MTETPAPRPPEKVNSDLTLRNTVNRITSPISKITEGGVAISPTSKELTVNQVKQATAFKVEEDETNLPDYLGNNLQSLLTHEEITRLGIQPKDRLDNQDRLKIVKHLIDKTAKDPTTLKNELKKLPDIPDDLNSIPNIIASLQAIGIESAQQEYLSSQAETSTEEKVTGWKPSDETFGEGSRRKLYTEMSGFGREVVLGGDDMKAIAKVGEKPVVEATVEMDLRLAQILLNTAVPPEYIVEVARLQQQVAAETDKQTKTQKAHELKLLRQKLYKSVLVAYNTKTEKDGEVKEFKVEDHEKAEIDQIAQSIRKRMNEVQRNGVYLKHMDIVEANSTSMQETAEYLGVTPQGSEMISTQQESILMNVHAGEKLSSAVHDFLQDPAFENVSSENRVLLEKILADRLRTRMSIGEIEEYYKKYNVGIKPENLSLSLFLTMGVKGTELLYRRSQGEEIKEKTEKTIVTEVPEWLNPKIPVLKLEQPGMEKILKRLEEEAKKTVVDEETSTAVAEKEATTSTETPPKEKGIPVYQGKENKMDVLNNGKNGKEYAVPFKMRLGEQHLQLPFTADSKNPNRVLILPDVNKPEAKSAYVLKQNRTHGRNGHGLYIKYGATGKRFPISSEDFSKEPFVFALNEQVALEIRGFNPETREVILHKIPSSPELWREQQSKLGQLELEEAPPATGTETVSEAESGAEAIPIAEEPVLEPTEPVAVPPSIPSETADVVEEIPPVSENDLAQAQTDEAAVTVPISGTPAREENLFEQLRRNTFPIGQETQGIELPQFIKDRETAEAESSVKVPIQVTEALQDLKPEQRELLDYILPYDLATGSDTNIRLGKVRSDFLRQINNIFEDGGEYEAGSAEKRLFSEMAFILGVNDQTIDGFHTKDRTVTNPESDLRIMHSLRNSLTHSLSSATSRNPQRVFEAFRDYGEEILPAFATVLKKDNSNLSRENGTFSTYAFAEDAKENTARIFLSLAYNKAFKADVVTLLERYPELRQTLMDLPGEERSFTIRRLKKALSPAEEPEPIPAESSPTSVENNPTSVAEASAESRTRRLKKRLSGFRISAEEKVRTAASAVKVKGQGLSGKIHLPFGSNKKEEAVSELKDETNQPDATAERSSTAPVEPVPTEKPTAVSTTATSEAASTITRAHETPEEYEERRKREMEEWIERKAASLDEELIIDTNTESQRIYDYARAQVKVNQGTLMLFHDSSAQVSVNEFGNTADKLGLLAVKDHSSLSVDINQGTVVAEHGNPLVYIRNNEGVIRCQDGSTVHIDICNGKYVSLSPSASVFVGQMQKGEFEITGKTPLIFSPSTISSIRFYRDASSNQIFTIPTLPDAVSLAEGSIDSFNSTGIPAGKALCEIEGRRFLISMGKNRAGEKAAAVFELKDVTDSSGKTEKKLVFIDGKRPEAVRELTGQPNELIRRFRIKARILDASNLQEALNSLTASSETQADLPLVDYETQETLMAYFLSRLQKAVKAGPLNTTPDSPLYQDLRQQRKIMDRYIWEQLKQTTLAYANAKKIDPTTLTEIFRQIEEEIPAAKAYSPASRPTASASADNPSSTSNQSEEKPVSTSDSTNEPVSAPIPETKNPTEELLEKGVKTQEELEEAETIVGPELGLNQDQFESMLDSIDTFINNEDTDFRGRTDIIGDVLLSWPRLRKARTEAYPKPVQKTIEDISKDVQTLTSLLTLSTEDRKKIAGLLVDLFTDSYIGNRYENMSTYINNVGHKGYNKTYVLNGTLRPFVRALVIMYRTAPPERTPSTSKIDSIKRKFF